MTTRRQDENKAESAKKKIRTEKKLPLDDIHSNQPKKKTKKLKVDEGSNGKKVQSENGEVMNVKKEIKSFNIPTIIPKTDINVNQANPDWPAEHVSELLRRLEKALPQRDKLSYKSRIEKINWEEIAFENYSGADCRVMWNALQTKVRSYRILGELIEDVKTLISKPRSKTNRHQEQSRRPLSAYFIFYLKKQDQVLQANPGLSRSELSKYIAEMYRNLSAESKMKYKKLAVEQKNEYDEKMKEFYRLHPELAQTKTKKEKSSAATAHASVPQRPSTPFKLFCEDELKRLESKVDFDKATFIEKCKEEWRTMSDRKKVFWINWSLDKETKYKDEMKKYISENPEFVPNAYKSVVTKEERWIKERIAGKPEKPPNSAYNLFSKSMLAMEDIKIVSPKDRVPLIAQLWKSCTDDEKKEYAERVKYLLEQYKIKYAEYLESLPEEERESELLSNQPKRKPKAPKPKPDKIENDRKKTKAVTKLQLIKKETNNTNQKKQKKIRDLYGSEPEPPPATPYLLFVKSYQASCPDKNNAQEIWKNMSNDQRSLHRQALLDMKKVYLKSYENFLKGLSTEELKKYAEWKENVNSTNHISDGFSDEESSTSDDECSENSDSGSETDVKKVAPR